MNRHLLWFSCGAASAYMAKLMTREIECEVLYCDTLSSEHPDNTRFFNDVEQWIGQKIKIIKSPIYKDVNDVIKKTKMMSTMHYAPCTVELKKTPREIYSHPSDTNYFGYTVEESRRVRMFEKNNPSVIAEFPLHERKIYKHHCLQALEKAGIEIPIMYKLGFPNNNCIGCVKAQSVGYWSLIKKNFPEVFKTRMMQEQLTGAKLLNIGGNRAQLKDIFSGSFESNDMGNDNNIECGPICVIPDRDNKST